MRKKIANIIKTKKLDLEPKRKKKKEDYNSIYIVSRKIKAELKHQAKK